MVIGKVLVISEETNFHVANQNENLLEPGRILLSHYSSFSRGGMIKVRSVDGLDENEMRNREKRPRRGGAGAQGAGRLKIKRGRNRYEEIRRAEAPASEYVSEK